MDFYVDDYKEELDSDFTDAINKAINLASRNNGRVIFKENRLYRTVRDTLLNMTSETEWSDKQLSPWGWIPWALRPLRRGGGGHDH